MNTPPSALPYVRIYTDNEGASRFERCHVALARRMFSPPAPPIDVSDAAAAASLALLRLPAGWRGEWHPSPARQWLFFLAGELVIEVSDGSMQRVSAGAIVLLEDTTGRGHETRVGDHDVVIAAVQLPPAGTQP